jgi:hypothetical protein
MTILTGKKLEIIDAPSTATSVANKSYVDLKAQQVQDALDLVTAGSDVNFDTLLEIKNLADSIRDTGASELTAQISAESAARISAVDTLTTDLSSEISNRQAAVDSLSSELSTALANEVSDRQAAISSEEDARIAGDNSLASALANEVSNREAAISSEEYARIAKDDELKMLAVNYSKKMRYVVDVYADSTSLPTPLELCNYTAGTNAANFDGWRMRNATAGSKFNFYAPAGGLKVGDVKAMYLELCAPSVVSMPFVTIYTTRKNDGKDYSSWYRSKITYIRNTTEVFVAGTNYNMVTNLKNVTVFNSNYFTQKNTQLEAVSSQGVGTISKANIGTATNVLEQVFNVYDNDDILAFAISSDSSSSVGNVECIISKFKLQLETGVCEFVFSNSDVFDNYMRERNSQLWNRLYGTSSSDNPYMNTSYTIPVPDYTIR